jgi:tetratricopeptide (TPR) repeat protein
MSSKMPIVRQTAWISLLPQLVFMGLLMFVVSLFVQSLNAAILGGAGLYLVISVTVRNVITRNQRKGIMLSKADKFPQAIEEYQKSYQFFNRHPWVDKFRSITLLSSSRISYTEMALINMAFCYAQSGNAELSKKYYQKALELCPKSEMAKSALNMIKAFEDKAKRTDLE